MTRDPRLLQRAPLMALEILVGTDIHLMSGADGFMLRAYVPNLQVEAKDAFLGACSERRSTGLAASHLTRQSPGGDIRVHSKEQELSYTKRLDINGARARGRVGRSQCSARPRLLGAGVTVGLSGVYNFATRTCESGGAAVPRVPRGG